MSRVLIIGGGLGGLCLAQGLRGAAVEVAVHERDASAGIRAQGYRVTLKQTGAAALRACLPPHLFDLAVATSIRPATRMIFMDTRLRPAFAKPIPPLPIEAGFGVNRLTLREILLAELDNVHFGSSGIGYTEAADQVTVHLAGGGEAVGDLLVGADGTHSAVRGQLLPAAGLDDLGWAVYGCTPLTPELLAGTPEELVDSFNRVVAEDGPAISIATCRPQQTPTAAAARLAPGVGLTDIPGYFSWTLAPTGPRPEAPTPAALHALATETARDWAEPVRAIIAAADVAATFPVTIRSAQPVAPWNAPRVTLLGDAVHTMSPGRGEGANVALRDAHLLRDLIAAATGQGAPLTRAKVEYEHTMLAYSAAAVEASRTHPFAPFARPAPLQPRSSDPPSRGRG